MIRRRIVIPDFDGFSKTFSVASVDPDDTNFQSQIVALAQKVGGEHLMQVIAKRVKAGFHIAPPYSHRSGGCLITEITPPLSEELVAALKYQWLKPAFEEWATSNNESMWIVIKDRLGVDQARFEKISRGEGGSLNSRERSKLNFLLEGRVTETSPAPQSGIRVVNRQDDDDDFEDNYAN